MDIRTNEFETLYAHLLEEWKICCSQNINDQRLPEIVSLPESGLQESMILWEERFEQMRAAQAEMVENGDWFAGRTDLLSILGRARREVDHCAILAWLLDPIAPNGLGILFLERFLALCFPERSFDGRQLTSATLRCEVCRDRSRADIVIRVGRLTLVIEAKVDHFERTEQCDDLYVDYRDDVGTSFVFLTPDGRTPVSATGAARDAFRSISFRSLTAALRDAIAAGGKRLAVHPALATISGYLQTLDGEFP
jgi:hypothetical protein